jgi:hypothetical protein
MLDLDRRDEREKIPTVKAPTSEDRPKGSTYGSNKREFHVLVDLCEGWEREFPGVSCPISKPLLLSQPDGAPDGILVTEHRDRPTYWRLSRFEDLQELYQTETVNPSSFAENLFRTIRVAHRLISGSFSNEAGSALSPSNITLDGEPKDFETFHSPRYGDPPVSRIYFLEDLLRGIEALSDLCKKISNDDNVVYGEYRKSIERAYEVYTNTVWNDSNMQADVRKILFGEDTIPSAQTPGGKAALKLAESFLKTQRWGSKEGGANHDTYI